MHRLDYLNQWFFRDFFVGCITILSIVLLPLIIVVPCMLAEYFYAITFELKSPSDTMDYLKVPFLHLRVVTYF
jgi:hypothetical protein